MAKDIRTYVERCLVCQRMKTMSKKSKGLLMPLPTPEVVWEDLSTDFITHLPLVKGKLVIIVGVDNLTKFCPNGALPSDFSSKMVSRFFNDNHQTTWYSNLNRI